MATDRTLTARLRTALSMLGFGPTICRFLQDVEARQGKLLAPVQSIANVPQRVGLFLARMGTASPIPGIIAYRLTPRDLGMGPDFRFSRPVLVISLLMLSSGMVLFVSIAFRLFR